MWWWSCRAHGIRGTCEDQVGGGGIPWSSAARVWCRRNSWQADQAERAAEETRAAAAADEDRKLKRLAKFQAKETAKAFTKAFNQGGSPPDQDSDSEEDAGSPGRK